MPIIEYICADKHTTEKIILSAAAAEKAHCAKCDECGKTAKRVDFSLTGAPGFVEGIGGFHKPTHHTPTTHSQSAADAYIKQMKSEAPGKKLTNILE